MTILFLKLTFPDAEDNGLFRKKNQNSTSYQILKFQADHRFKCKTQAKSNEQTKKTHKQQNPKKVVGKNIRGFF